VSTAYWQLVPTESLPIFTPDSAVFAGIWSCKGWWPAWEQFWMACGWRIWKDNHLCQIVSWTPSNGFKTNINCSYQTPALACTSNPWALVYSVYMYICIYMLAFRVTIFCRMLLFCRLHLIGDVCHFLPPRVEAMYHIEMQAENKDHIAARLIEETELRIPFSQWVCPNFAISILTLCHELRTNGNCCYNTIINI